MASDRNTLKNVKDALNGVGDVVTAFSNKHRKKFQNGIVIFVILLILAIIIIIAMESDSYAGATDMERQQYQDLIEQRYKKQYEIMRGLYLPADTSYQYPSMTR